MGNQIKAQKKVNVQKIAFLGLMQATIIVLSALEHMIPPIPLLPPNVKLGLSNIVTMYCLFVIGKKEAILLTVLKSCFILLMRGPIASILSLTGGLCSIFILILLITVFKKKVSYTVVSIAGAITHNLGQLAAVSFLMNNNFVLYYFPVLLVSGVIMGSVTGILLKVVMPFINKIKRF